MAFSSSQTSKMFVIKRNGEKETVLFDKITSRINKLCYGESPLKCLNHQSPIKRPNLLEDPFNKAAKRRLNLGGSPRKKTRVIEINEDANLEPPQKRNHLTCHQNDWILRTKCKLKFPKQCANWTNYSSSTHRRVSAGILDESPCKQDKSISLEAIKNVATVYQHPYLPWQPVFPRNRSHYDNNTEKAIDLKKLPQVVEKMRDDWCESFNDLVNMLIRGKVPYFYLCSDRIDILFKSVPSSRANRPTVQAFLTPLSYSLSCSLEKINVEFKTIDIPRTNSSSALSNYARDFSQQSLASSQTQTTYGVGESITQNSTPASKAPIVTPSNNSGNVSKDESESDNDADDQDFYYKGSKVDGDASQILGTLGLSPQELGRIASRSKGFTDTNSNTQSRKYLPLASIEGTENVRKLVKFFQTKGNFMVDDMGKFACIPPTLLSPREFRLCTPQYPIVKLSENMIEKWLPNEVKQRTDIYVTPKKSDLQEASSSNNATGPTFIELHGPILPNVYNQLHKLLATSDNVEHSCTFTQLESTRPFGSVSFEASS